MSENKYAPTQLMVDWVAALNDPDRKQATGVLGRTDSQGNVTNCCLGVLCDVAGNVGTARDADAYDFVLIYKGPTARGDVSLPDSSLVKSVLGDAVEKGGTYLKDNIILGVKPDAYDGDSSTITASEANDEWGWTFQDIADQLRKVYIEGNGNPYDFVIGDFDRRTGDVDDDDCGCYDCC